MGAFNTLAVEAEYPSCHRTGPFELQFKYGDTWQLQYALGETLKWGGNDTGRPGMARVRVDGCGGPCVHCGTEFLEFSILVRHDVLTAVLPEPVPPELQAEDGYYVIEDEGVK